ncbi:3-oxoacyl-[acyl-carrier-protein] synthase-3 [Filibacter limicola]|uniref:3-oxoacyl-[acyl-carrier-protein] synthase-3 n=1 Tax=Sporosarcina limicola TaxID=34101 RepID=A0A927MIW0_9BACL|nr:3-oxoacyl-[acyl-carrier-protein] synthase-3 [Sporosarcina limicola]
MDLIIVATTTPDYPFPSVACLVQDALGIQNTGAIDINAACAGFTHALHLANCLITAEAHKKILVIGTETLTKVTDYTDRSSCILFGDGAGAVMVERDENFSGFLVSHLGSNGDGGEHLYRSGLSKTMKGKELAGSGNIVQNGREVYKWAIRTIPKGMNELLEKNNMSVSDLDWFVPHSANLRMIESITEKLEIDKSKLLHSVEFFGNTSSASIPLALDLAVKDGKLKYNDTLAIYGYGGGLNHAGLILKWGVN